MVSKPQQAKMSDNHREHREVASQRTDIMHDRDRQTDLWHNYGVLMMSLAISRASHLRDRDCNVTFLMGLVRVLMGGSTPSTAQTGRDRARFSLLL